MRLIELLLEGQPIFEAAHDLSQGGLASSLTEMALRHGVGAEIFLKGDIAIALFSETPGRVVVAIEPENAGLLRTLAERQNIFLVKIGKSGGEVLAINSASIPLTELREAFTQTFPKLFG